MFPKNYGHGVIVVTLSPITNTYKTIQEFGHKTTHYFRFQPSSSQPRFTSKASQTLCWENNSYVSILNPNSGHGAGMLGDLEALGGQGGGGEEGCGEEREGGTCQQGSLAELPPAFRTFPFSLFI